MNFENKPKLGIGIYSATEIAQILRIRYHKVYLWMNKYWDGKLRKGYESQYSWQVNGKRAVSFHTFIEFHVMMQFSDAGVKPRRVLEAHQELSRIFNTPFPFAMKKVLDGIRTDGNIIFLETDKGTITLDGTKQFNLEFIRMFSRKMEFSDDDLASRFWPMGKENSILIDPERRFGHPVIDGKNIFPEVINNHFTAGDPIKYIAYVYELSEEEVINAIEFCKAA